MSAFMSDRTPEERRFMRLQLVVYDILRAEDGGLLATPPLVDDFVRAILALDPKSAESGEREKALERALTDQIGWLETVVAGTRFAKPEAGRVVLLLERVEQRLTALHDALAAAPKPPEKPRG